eukprot:COSAG01_NODE_1381_length_10520_cov_2.661710_14_plen_126_part_00
MKETLNILRNCGLLDSSLARLRCHMITRVAGTIFTVVTNYLAQAVAILLHPLTHETVLLRSENYAHNQSHYKPQLAQRLHNIQATRVEWHLAEAQRKENEGDASSVCSSVATTRSPMRPATHSGL